MKTELFILSSALGAALLSGCASNPKSLPLAAPSAAPAETDAWRAEVPAPGPQPALRAPVPTIQVMPNGLHLLAVHRPAMPVVQVSMMIRSGSAADPVDRPGLAAFVAEMLRTGTKTRSAEKLADDLETMGSHLQISADEDSLVVSAACLSERFDDLVAILTDVLRNSSLAPEEVERIRRQQLASLTQAGEDPRYTAERVFRRVVLGEHPYAHMVLGERSAIEKIRRSDLTRFLSSAVTPANVAVVVVGDVPLETVSTSISRSLGSWVASAGPQVAKLSKISMPGDAPEVALVDRPGAPQSQLRVGHLGVRRLNPDYFSLVIGNSILGGSFNSRINMNLREDKGYTYGARSQFDMGRSTGTFLVGTSVETTVTAPAVQEIISEIEKMRTAEVSPEELADAKSRFSLSLSGYFQTVGTIAAMLAEIDLYELPADYYQTLPERIQAVTAADVLRAAREHLRPAALSVIVVGDGARVRQSLTELGRGPIRARDPEGRAVSPAKAPESR